MRLIVNPPLRFPQSSRCSPCLQTVNKCQCVLRTDVCCSVLGSEITFPGLAHSFPLDHKSSSRQVNHKSRQGDNLSRAEPALCGSMPSKTSLTQFSRPEEQTHWFSCTLSVQPRHTQGCWVSSCELQKEQRLWGQSAEFQETQAGKDKRLFGGWLRASKCLQLALHDHQNGSMNMLLEFQVYIFARFQFAQGKRICYGAVRTWGGRAHS